MLHAFGLGAASQLSLILSGLMVFVVSVPKQVAGGLAAFGAGALIAAVARDLLPEAHVLQIVQVSLWAMLGAVAFIAGERYVDRRFGSEGSAGALGIVVGAVVDGIPESIIFGIQLASGKPFSIAFVAAVFVSNIPQAIPPSADLAATGWNWRRVAGLWSGVVLVCGLASLIGYAVGSDVTAVHGARMAAFASGGILAMLSGSLIPFAHDRSNDAGFWTVVGFCAALGMS